MLTAAIAELADRGHWGFALDLEWRIVAETAEVLTASGRSFITGTFQYGPEAIDLENPTLEVMSRGEREALRHLGSWMLSDFGLDREELRALVHPALRDVVDDLVDPGDSPVTSWATVAAYLGDKIGSASVAFRVPDAAGEIVGTVLVVKPNVGMNTIAMLTASGDLGHLQRMHGLARVGRRPAAVLFADLEGSAQLSKRMPTAAYFTLVRRMTRAADQCVIDEGGLVGRHVGDGVAAFFVAETAGSESAAARACIAAARSLQAAMLHIAERHDLPAGDVTVRAGLHWGATLYIGSIITIGRSEVTALGDEVNEAARIEACASGGRVLASKTLLERLDTDDSAALGIDPNLVSYTQLADLDTATEKARRDAPAIAVCDLALSRS